MCFLFAILCLSKTGKFTPKRVLSRLYRITACTVFSAAMGPRRMWSHLFRSRPIMVRNGDDEEEEEEEEEKDGDDDDEDRSNVEIVDHVIMVTLTGTTRNTRPMCY